MYLKFFGFEEKPFHITPNPRFIFLSSNHKEAFAHVLYGIKQRVGFLSLTGEVGTGKTTVLRTLLKQLEETELRVALIFNPCLSALELLQTIHREFGITYDENQPSLVKLHDSLNHFLLEQRTKGVTVVLVIDEAQNLAPAVLEEMRLLSNLETETDKLIQMVLVGQPELELLLKRPDLRQLRQRLAVRYQLHPMNAADTRCYIEHRLAVAGWSGGALFSDKALDTVFRLTKGTPRLINILCDRILLTAYGNDIKHIDKSTVMAAQRELNQERQEHQPWMIRALIPVLTMLILVAAGFLFWPYVNGIKPSISTPIKIVKSEPQVQLPGEKRGNHSDPVSSPEPAFEQQPSATSEVNLSIPAARGKEALRTVTPLTVAALQKQVARLSGAQTGYRATSAVLDAWDLVPPAGDYKYNRGKTIEKVIGKTGLSVINFNGTLDQLLTFNTPAILTLTLPNVYGNRYLALLASKEGKVLLEPRLNDSGWITEEELEKLWFGRAMLPWNNFARIPYLDQPGQSSPNVEKLQELLQANGNTDLRVNGEYDWPTIEAVTTFQQIHNLAPDGRVGSRTLLLLYQMAGENMPRLASGEVL